MGWTLSAELLLSGIPQCASEFIGDAAFLTQMAWILTTAWEIFAVCLAIWIAVKHFRELERPSIGWAVGDCFKILVETHVFYFAR